MKKSLLTVCIVFSVLIGFSQIVSLGNAVNMVSGTITEGDLVVTGWEIVNATNETIDFGCKRLAVQEVAGATSQFCWGTLCSPFGTGFSLSTEIVTLAPGAYSSSFYAHYRHNENVGQSILKYCWFDNNNPMNEFCYDVNYCVDVVACVVNVEEQAMFGQIGQISPNPLSSTGNISYSFLAVPNSGKLSIYNVVGSLVKQVSLTKKNGTVIINAADFESGIYFCNIENNGKIFETKRLVISK